LGRKDIEARVFAEVGSRVRSTRTRAHITQEQAAARAGIDVKRWQRLENGSVNATLRTLLRVARALDVSI
jgi:transcriptional regulator with XRE-family HTH domain